MSAPASHRAGRGEVRVGKLRWRQPRPGRAAALGLAVGLLATTGTVAADGTPGITVAINGQPLSTPFPPIMINDHVYVPVRYVAQALGLPVQWDPATSTVWIGAIPTASVAAGGSFDYQGLHYAVTGLVVRNYPGPQSTSGSYWIVSYSITNTGTQPVNVPQQQPTLVLLGPGGVQLQASSNLSGPTPTVINPGITFSSYLVFNVPTGAVPAQYGLGFNTYQVVGSQFITTPLSAPLPSSSSSEVSTPVGSTYALTNLWNAGTQKISIDRVVQTTAVAPDLSPGSFNPSTTFWIVDFDVLNPGPANISFSASNFALTFGSYSILPLPIVSLPGYVLPSNLTQPGGVTLGPGDTFSGSLVFAVPANVAAGSPALQINVNGQLRIISLQPCSSGPCPPVQQ
jgi:hypothetical protein